MTRLQKKSEWIHCLFTRRVRRRRRRRRFADAAAASHDGSARRRAAAPDSMAASHQRHFRDVYIFVYSFLKFLRQLIISISDVKTDRL